ncbi:MAG: IS1 family transposase [Desulfococcaceae bacterium]
MRSSAVSEEHKPWIWPAANRETRQTAGAASGDRSDKTCLRLWESLPDDYRKHAVIYTDYWESYRNVIPSERLRQSGKESGETAHTERFNNTLRRRCACMVRKTLSFSRNREMHGKRIRMFVSHYNESLMR